MQLKGDGAHRSFLRATGVGHLEAAEEISVLAKRQQRSGPSVGKHHFRDTSPMKAEGKQPKRGVPESYAVPKTAMTSPRLLLAPGFRGEHPQQLLRHRRPRRSRFYSHPSDRALRHTPCPRRNCSQSLLCSRKQFSLGLTKYLLK